MYLKKYRGSSTVGGLKFLITGAGSNKEKYYYRHSINKKLILRLRIKYHNDLRHKRYKLIKGLILLFLSLSRVFKLLNYELMK
jgi:hypothetical protein